MACATVCLHQSPVSADDFVRVESAAIEPARGPAPEGTPHPVLRVGLWTLWHDRAVQVAPISSNTGLTARTCPACAPISLRQLTTIRADNNQLSLTGAGITAHASHLSIDSPVMISAHGESETIHHPLSVAARDGFLVLAVTLPRETYVERVVASESGPDDSAASLQALAIVVRSYALHVRHGHADYDLCDSTHCQLLHWRGNGAREHIAHAATLHTAGETLWFRGHPARAWFHKDCGGYTAAPPEIWTGSAAQPYLPARPDAWCSRSGGGQWSSEISRDDLASALAARGLAASGWQSVAVSRRASSGRVLTVRVDTREIPAESFRLAVGAALGWNRIPSTWFEVSRRGDTFYFHGRGWGHGVGLCQKGAAAMAAQSRSAREILEQYFPGAEPVDDLTGRPWQRLSGPGFTLESLDSTAKQFLPVIAQMRAEASQRSGLEADSAFTIRTFPSTPAYRDATLSTGWTAAFTEGDWIATQPLRTLASRHLLAGTLLHEFLHALVEGHSGPQTPLWLREGLVEFWSSSPAAQSAYRSRALAQMPDAVETALTHSAGEAQSAAAHREAAICAARLLDRHGRGQVLAWLRSGVPASVLTALR